MALFLLLVIVTVVLGTVGPVANGLGYLLITGIVLLVADPALMAVRWSRGAGRRPIR
jgi:hypothetical protein